jgi:hypothetical protein
VASASTTMQRLLSVDLGLLPMHTCVSRTTALVLFCASLIFHTPIHTPTCLSVINATQVCGSLSSCHASWARWGKPAARAPLQNLRQVLKCIVTSKGWRGGGRRVLQEDRAAQEV